MSPFMYLAVVAAVEVCLLIQVPFSAVPGPPAVFVQLDAPTELHDCLC